jgi:hypothetical protein
MLSKRFATIEGHLTRQKKDDGGNFVFILGPSTLLNITLPSWSEASHA